MTSSNINKRSKRQWEVGLSIEGLGLMFLFRSMLELSFAWNSLHKDNLPVFCGWTLSSAHALVLGIYLVRDGERLLKISSYRLALKWILNLLKYTIIVFLVFLAIMRVLSAYY